MKINYNPALKQRARDLRNNSTESEILFWNQVKNRNIKGYQFMRQKPIGNYIVDFYCSKLRLIIEIDGEVHKGKKESDAYRQLKIESKELEFLRFENRDVQINMSHVIYILIKKMEEIEIRKS